MKNNDRYKLLFNQLWLASNAKVKQLNPKQPLPSSLEVVNQVAKASVKINPSPQIATDAIKANDDLISAINPSPTLLEATALIANWDELVNKATNCTDCKLCYGRKNVVIERGNRVAQWMFIGEGPGEQEDIQGRSFVGVSGQLLDKMIKAMQLDPAQDIYICNVVKCRPPYNRNPQPEEISACKNYLLSQINLVKPKIIITLGRFASQTILNTEVATGKLRGRVHYFTTIPVIVTYHPAYLLRNPSAKKAAWEDLQLAMKVFG